MSNVVCSNVIHFGLMPVYWHDNDTNLNINLYGNIHVSLIKTEKL